MGIFGKKRQPIPRPKVDFSGQDVLAELKYHVGYEDLLEGLEITAALQPRWRIYAGSAVFIFFALFATVTLFGRSVLLGLLGVLVTAYLVVNAFIGPAFGRKQAAKRMAEQQLTDTVLRIYQSGLQVMAGNQAGGLGWRQMYGYESRRQYTILIGGAKMLVFPKEQLGEFGRVLGEMLALNLGKRYFQVDDKGRVI